MLFEPLISRFTCTLILMSFQELLYRYSCIDDPRFEKFLSRVWCLLKRYQVSFCLLTNQLLTLEPVSGFVSELRSCVCAGDVWQRC